MDDGWRLSHALADALYILFYYSSRAPQRLSNIAPQNFAYLRISSSLLFPSVPFLIFSFLFFSFLFFSSLLFSSLLFSSLLFSSLLFPFLSFNFHIAFACVRAAPHRHLRAYSRIPTYSQSHVRTRLAKPVCVKEECQACVCVHRKADHRGSTDAIFRARFFPLQFMPGGKWWLVLS
jgi:hypothetical protein